MRTQNPRLYPKIAEFIDEYRDQYNLAPSVQEVANYLGVSKATASRYLCRMREEGTVTCNGYRSISTLESKENPRQTVKVAVLGRVSCGIPKFAEENIEEYVRLPVALFGRGDFFILRANGDSMIDAGIDDNDLVIVRQQNYADPGQIVVALVENEATLKRYYPEPRNKRIRLHPENKNLEDIYVDNCLIQGVAVKVIKDL
ncbi:transcriptional repressor LexA [Candidatus Allofournierella excrementavium]|uniref:transcriptional repressor LexA n=1 Tax=Candidatus Allofournierella excrementavium TaxID=2838591 RepID=UPI003AF82FA3